MTLLRSLQPTDMKNIPQTWQHCCWGTSVHSVEIEGWSYEGLLTDARPDFAELDVFLIQHILLTLEQHFNPKKLS